LPAHNLIATLWHFIWQELEILLKQKSPNHSLRSGDFFMHTADGSWRGEQEAVFSAQLRLKNRKMKEVICGIRSMIF
jgi:hypothetical protein